MAAIAREMHKGFRHECSTKTVVLGDGFGHISEKHVTISRLQAVRIRPVHLELTVGVLVVVLVRPPTKSQHRVTDFSNHRKAAHQRGLIITGFILCIIGIGDGTAIRRDQKILTLHAGHHLVTRLLSFGNLALQGDAWRGFDLLTIFVASRQSLPPEQVWRAAPRTNRQS